MSLVCASPQTLRIGDTPVILNERFAMRRVESLLDRGIRAPKVPGPWTDEKGADAANREKKSGSKWVQAPPRNALERAALDKAKKLTRRMEGIASMNRQARRNQQTGLLSTMFGTDARRRGAFMNKVRSQLSRNRGNTPVLSSFREGRYEDVVRAWGEKSAAQRGVHARQHMPYRMRTFARPQDGQRGKDTRTRRKRD
jgi:hypothetical protein